MVFHIAGDQVFVLMMLLLVMPGTTIEVFLLTSRWAKNKDDNAFSIVLNFLAFIIIGLCPRKWLSNTHCVTLLIILAIIWVINFIILIVKIFFKHSRRRDCD